MASTPEPPNSDAGSFPRDPLLPEDAPTQSADTVLFRRYRVIRELGRGGMGVVLLAHDTALEIPVAVKLVPDLVVKDAEAIADLRNEVLRGMALAHPGIVRTHNFERDESGAGIVMEFVEGDTLTDLKAAQPDRCFDPEQILGWLEQLCAVLDYAHHDAHIVHRDLKPRNLMLTKAGRVKVADFGIAAVLNDSMSRHSMEGKISGTLGYMSPQQAQGLKPSRLDDIHALGATIYELLTGRPPFFRGNESAIFQQILHVAPPSLAERRHDLEVTGKAPIPTAWEEIIAACLAKEPGERPQSAGEVFARLRACPLDPVPLIPPPEPPCAAPVPAMDEAGASIAPTPLVGDAASATVADETVPAPPAPATPPPRRNIRRGPAKVRAVRWLTWAAAAGIVVAFLAGSGLFSRRGRPLATTTATPAQLAVATPMPPQSTPAATSASPGKGFPMLTEIPDPFMDGKVPTPVQLVGTPPKPLPVSAKSLSTPPPPQTRYQDLVMQGKQLRDRGDTSTAIIKLREAATVDPKNPEAMAALALTYEKMNLPEKAAEQWRRIFDMGDAAGVYFALSEARLKMAQAQVLVAARAATPAPASSASPVSRTRPDALLGLDEITRSDFVGSTTGRFTMTVPIKAKAGATISVADVDINVLFYDLVGGERVEQTTAEVSYRWASAPIDWANGAAETLQVEYAQAAPAPKAKKTELHAYYGYIVRLYYKGVLQDFRADPESLNAKFPTPSTPAPPAR